MNELTKCVYLFQLGKFNEAGVRLQGKPERNKTLSDTIRFLRKYRIKK
jgi:hypothetical protein